MTGKFVSGLLVVTLAFLSTVAASGPAQAQGTTFTYQGKLEVAGSPANGTFDLVFSLYDAATGGTQFGTNVCVDDVAVTEGVFTVPLDFGSQFATSAERHLEILVRSDTGLGCGDGTGFVLLSPRQPVTPTPMATHANAAFSLDAPDGSPASAVFVDNSGNVGIGTTAPFAPLHVRGVGPWLALQDMAASGNQAGYISYRNDIGTETAWVGYGTPGSPDFSIVNARSGGALKFWMNGERMAITSTGRVGIGTSAPAKTLDVRGAADIYGDIRMGGSLEYQAAAGEERLRIIRGRVLSGGTISTGTGFTVTRNSTGVYTIDYVPNFAVSSQPTVTVSVDSNSGAYAGMIVGSLYTATQIHIRTGGGTLTDQNFQFIVIGPR